MAESGAPHDSHRRVATVLFTDIVGSTKRLAELGDAKWHALLRRHNELVRESIERHGGREVSTAGDSFLAMFGNPAQAIECAVEAAEAVSKEGIQIRAGLHTGEIVETATDVRGIAVHIGARVSAKAGAGEVLVSRTVRDLARGSDHEFEPRGTFVLKGVPGQWRLYAVAGTARRGGPLREARVWVDRHRRLAVASLVVVMLAFGAVAVSVLIRATEPRFSPERLIAADAPAAIAVLPFTVRGEGTEIWREGMVDILSTGLDGAAGLRTISSRTLLARWAQEVVDNEAADITTALEVAWETGARYALVGSVVVAGPNMRLIAEAYDIDTGSRLGQAQVEGAPDEVLSLCDRLGVEMLAIILQKGEEELGSIELASLGSDSTEAVLAYLEGEVHYRHFDMREAREAYERAVEADSTFALAHYRLGYVGFWAPLDVGSSIRSGHHFRSAAQYADRLPPREGVYVKTMEAWIVRTQEALEPLQQAIERYPDDAQLRFLLGEVYLHNAFAPAEEIDRLFERAVELEPGDATYLTHHLDFAWWLHADSTRAARLLERYEEILRGNAEAYRIALDLAFGDSEAQAEAMDRLRATNWDGAGTVNGLLHHPRYSARLDLLREFSQQGNERQKSRRMGNLFRTTALWYGRLQESLPYLSDPVMSIQERSITAYEASVLGLPIPEEVLERELGPARIDTISGRALVLTAGAFAAERGPWSDHERAIEILKQGAERSLAEGNPGRGMAWTSSAKALEGYGLLRRGRPTDALPFLEDSGTHIYPLARLWLGELYEDLGRFQDAARVYSGYAWLVRTRIATEPLIQNRLGRVYERLEEYDKARESYEYFVTYWNDADPELQPMVEEARQAIRRLEGLQRR